MNYTQNQKIEQVTESTLVLGVDIGSSEHYVRAFDYRGRELTRKVFRFSTDINGFNSFYDWVTQICIKHGKNEAMIGCEPTGHYWYTFYQFVRGPRLPAARLISTLRSRCTQPGHLAAAG